MEPFLAQIMGFGGNFAPRGWAFCEGQLLPIAQYSALFSLLGTTYGGDGRTTFGLPDLRGRSAIGHGNGPGLASYRLGNKGGFENVTLITSQIPSHNHGVALHAENKQGETANPAGKLLAGLPGLYAAQDNNQYASMAPQSITENNVGGNQSHENRSPYLAISWIIALQGIFPSRS